MNKRRLIALVISVCITGISGAGFALNLKKECKKGNGIICYNLGLQHLAKNPKKSVALLKEACKKGYPDGCLTAAKILAHEEYGIQNIAAAIPLFEKSLEAVAAECKAQGPKDHLKGANACSQLRERATQNADYVPYRVKRKYLSTACRKYEQLSCSALKEIDYWEAIRLIRKGCELGHAQSCYLAAVHENLRIENSERAKNNESIQVRYERAQDYVLRTAELLQKACASNDAIACLQQLILGNPVENSISQTAIGKLVFWIKPRDRHISLRRDAERQKEVALRAFSLFAQGCDQGNGNECFGMAYVIKNMPEIDAPIALVTEDLRARCKNNDSVACRTISNLRIENSFALFKQAVKILQSQCDEGVGDACYSLEIERNLRLMSGTKRSKFGEQAISYFGTKCSAGDFEACYKMMIVFANVKYTGRATLDKFRVNIDSARDLYFSKCESGDATACYKSARMLRPANRSPVEQIWTVLFPWNSPVCPAY